ncbi:MAG: sulfatase [Polyangiaceae bacterium]|nr:sulfatase [Polyangiaceae bacterium]
MTKSLRFIAPLHTPFDPTRLALVLVPLVVADSLRAEASGPLVWLAAAGLAAGLCVGSALAFNMLARLPRLAVIAIACALGLALAHWASDDLNAIARLGSSEWLKASGALAGSAVAGFVTAGAIITTVPLRPGANAWASATERRRRIVLVILAAAVVGSIVFDRTSYPRSYPAAHFVARALMLVALTCAVSILPIRAVPAKWRRAAGGSLAIAMVLPWLLLGSQPTPTSHGLLDRPLPRFALEIHRALTDIDGDGFAPLLGGGDCAAWNGHVHPGAPDVPSNGVDENCLGGDRQPSVPPPEPAPNSSARRLSVVLITVDALRPDRLGVYGAERPTSPNLDEWSKGALVFDRAYTSGGWTSVALSSLMRGVWARRLEWTAIQETNRLRLLRRKDVGALKGGEILARTFSLPLEDERPTLPELLEDNGVDTYAVLDDGATGYFRPELGAFTGFGTIKLTDKLARKKRTDAGTTDLAISAIKNLDKKGPFFLWVHYFGPHAPVQRHKEAPSFGEKAIDLYDHEIAFTDREIGRLLDVLDAPERASKTAVLVAADHGEEFDGERRYHGLSLRESAIRIPLMARIPGIVGTRCSAAASLVDVSATIASLTNTPVPSHFDGMDLRRVCEDAPSRILFVDTWRFDHRGRTFYDATAAVDGSKKSTWSLLDGDRAKYEVAGFAETYAPGTDAAELDEALQRQLEATGLVVLGD